LATHRDLTRKGFLDPASEGAVTASPRAKSNGRIDGFARAFSIANPQAGLGKGRLGVGSAHTCSKRVLEQRLRALSWRHVWVTQQGIGAHHLFAR